MHLVISQAFSSFHIGASTAHASHPSPAVILTPVSRVGNSQHSTQALGTRQTLAVFRREPAPWGNVRARVLTMQCNAMCTVKFY